MATSQERTQMVAWIALVTALIALFVAAATFNQVSGMQSASQSQSKKSGEQTALDNAKLRLEKLRRDVSTGVKDVDIEKEMTDIRDSLQHSLPQLNATTQSTGSTLNTKLTVIQENLRKGTVSALEAIDQMIRELQNNVR